MYPHNVELLGRSVSIWNTVFLAAAFAGCLTLRASTAAEPRLNFFVVRCLVSLYLIVLGGQLFAYAFDANPTPNASPSSTVSQGFPHTGQFTDPSCSSSSVNS